MRKKLLVISLMLLILMFVGCGAVELETPSNLNYEYSNEANSVQFTWDEVENATGYQIDYGNGKSISNVGMKTTGVLENPAEGATYIAKIRAICEKGSKTYYSGWASIEYTIPVMLGMPKDITGELSGKVLKISWVDAQGATSYEANVNDEIISAMDNNVQVKVSEGESGTIYVRAVRTIDSGEYYSDWVSFDYSVPVINLEDVSYYTAFLLDYNKLLEWTNYCGYSYEVYEEIINEVNHFVVDVSCEDSLNSGFWNAVGRTVDSAVGAYIDGYVSETIDSYTSDFSTVENTLGTMLGNDSVKGYVEGVDEAANHNGTANAIFSGLRALGLDTNKHFKYYYQNADNAAVRSECFFLKNGRETYEEDNWGQFEVQDDGKYHLFNKKLQQNYCLDIQEITKDSHDYWVLISSKE